MTDYLIKVIDPLKDRFAADEWQNPSLTPPEIIACTAELFKLIDNNEVIMINRMARDNQELLQAEKECRDWSNKAAKKGAAYDAMMLAHKKALFIRHQILANYVWAKYIAPNNNKITGRTGGKAV